MPLDTHKEGGIVWHFHTLNQFMRGKTGCGQFWRQTADCLVVHTVDLDFIAACDLEQAASGEDGDGVGGNLISKRLGMGDGEILLKLAGDILIDIASKSDINKLDAAADAKEWLLRFYDKL